MNQFPNKTKHVLISLGLIAVAIFAYYYWGGGGGSGAVSLENIPEEVRQNVEKISGSRNVFKHPALGFSFEYLSGYALTELEDGEGETILMQRQGKGAQVYISDFTASIAFNSALVKSELVGEKVDNLKDITTTGGFSAVSFSSSDPSLGETSELWFVNGGKLYQITAESGNDALLKTIADSWKFQ